MFATKTDETLTAGNVIVTCQSRVTNYNLPKEVYFVAMDELPRSTSEKIQRHVPEERLGQALARINFSSAYPLS